MPSSHQLVSALPHTSIPGPRPFTPAPDARRSRRCSHARLQRRQAAHAPRWAPLVASAALARLTPLPSHRIQDTHYIGRSLRDGRGWIAQAEEGLHYLLSSIVGDGADHGSQGSGGRGRASQPRSATEKSQYFSQGKDPRTSRSGVKFRVGQVVKHKLWGYRGGACWRRLFACCTPSLPTRLTSCHLCPHPILQ